MYFYETPVITLSASETLTNEVSLAVPASSAIKLELEIPIVASGVRIYRSTAVDTETLLVDLPFGDIVRIRTGVYMPFQFIDDGTLSTGVTPYPTSTALTSLMQEVVPVPDVVLSNAGTGSLAANTYYYRVSFYTQVDIGLKFITDSVEQRFYHPDASAALVSSKETITHPDYTVITDIFNYLDPFDGELSFSTVQAGNDVLQAQEVIIGPTVQLKPVAFKQTVMLSTPTRTVLANIPVNIVVNPPDVEVEVIENALVGTPQYFKGVTPKIFTTLGTVQYQLNRRASILYALTAIAFKIV